MNRSPSLLTNLLALTIMLLSSSLRAQQSDHRLSSPLPDDMPALENVSQATPPPPSGPWTPASTSTSPNPARSFFAVSDEDRERNPPDVQGAVGPNHVVTMLNTVVRIQDRTSNVLSTVTLSNWWGFLVSSDSPFDPRIVYDPYQNRWIAIAVANRRSSTSAVMIAVTTNSDPTTTWYKHQINADSLGTNSADFPMLGFNKDWVAVTANMYINNGGFTNARIWVFNKTNLYAGGTNRTVFTDTRKASSLAPALTYDTNLARLYLLTVWSPTNGMLASYMITGAVTSPTLVVTNAFPTITNTIGGWRHESTSGAFGPQLSNTDSTVKIDLGDSRIGSPIIYRNGSLWCTHTVYLPNVGATGNAAIQWWQIPISSFNPLQVGRFYDSNEEKQYGYPSIAVNRFNDVLIGFSRCGYDQFPSANYTYRDACDPINSSVRTDVLLKDGEDLYWWVAGNFPDKYTPWGDYSATVVDPVNDIDMWTIQQYARTHVGALENYSGRWGTWWAQVTPDVPANDHFTNAITLTNYDYGTLVRATRESGEPNHAGTNATSVWYKWTAPTNTPVRLESQILSQCGSSALGVSIAVYRGSAVNALITVTNRFFTIVTNQLIFTPATGTNYSIAISGFNATSGTFYIGLNQTNAPMIGTQPSSWDVYQGSNVTFNVEASGDAPLRFQWRRHNPTNLTITTNLVGETNIEMNLTNVQPADIGNYSAVVTNTLGSATSSLAHLYVYLTEQATLTGRGFNTTQYLTEVKGITGANYVVEASTNLINWLAIQTNQTTFTNIDTSVTNKPYRFYRALYQP